MAQITIKVHLSFRLGTFNPHALFSGDPTFAQVLIPLHTTPVLGPSLPVRTIPRCSAIQGKPKLSGTCVSGKYRVPKFFARVMIEFCQSLILPQESPSFKYVSDENKV